MPISAQYSLAPRPFCSAPSRAHRSGSSARTQQASLPFHGEPPPQVSATATRLHGGIGRFRSNFRSGNCFRLDRRSAGVVAVGASPVPDEVPKEQPGGLAQTVELVVLIALWYIFNIYFNICNKQVLKVYPFPVTISACQFAFGSIVIFIMWSTNLYKRPRISTSQLAAILPLAIAHTLGNLFTNMSLGKVSVSFTHTIKAMEPFFTVLFSALFLGELPTMWIISSLVPIVGGVALASFTEASFNWTGFWSAMASNVTNQSRNVLSKKLMAQKEETLDNITLFSIITIMSFFLTVPVTLFVEGFKLTPSYLQSTGLNLREIYVSCFIAGLCFHAYQQVSYIILAKSKMTIDKAFPTHYTDSPSHQFIFVMQYLWRRDVLIEEACAYVAYYEIKTGVAGFFLWECHSCLLDAMKCDSAMPSTLGKIKIILLIGHIIFLSGKQSYLCLLQAVEVLILTFSLLPSIIFHLLREVGFVFYGASKHVLNMNLLLNDTIQFASTLFFHRLVSSILDLYLVAPFSGTAVALAGVFLYSRVKKIKPKTA